MRPLINAALAAGVTVSSPSTLPAAAAVREFLLLTTFDTAILHQAGDHTNHVLVPTAN